MGFIKSYLRDRIRTNPGATAVGRAAVPPRVDEVPTLGLPHALGQLNDTRGYVGRRGDIKARNRSAGPRYRSPEVAL